MDRQGLTNRPRYQLTRGLIGVDNEKDVMPAHRHLACHLVNAHSMTSPASGNTGWLFCCLVQLLHRPVKQLSIG